MFGRHKDVLIDPEADPTSIGNLIVADGLITHEKLLELVVEFQQYAGSMLGIFLVEKGVLSAEKLQLVLLRQKAVRNGGVEHEHVMEAMRIADGMQARVTTQVDRLVSVTAFAASKVGVK